MRLLGGVVALAAASAVLVGKDLEVMHRLFEWKVGDLVEESRSGSLISKEERRVKHDVSSAKEDVTRDIVPPLISTPVMAEH